MDDFRGTIPREPLITAAADDALKRRAARLLTRLEAISFHLELNDYEARLLLDLALWQSVMSRSEDVDWSVGSAFGYLEWLLIAHLDYVSARKSLDELASKEALDMIKDSMLVFQQLILLDLLVDHRLDWRMKHIVAEMKVLRKSGYDEAHINFVKNYIRACFAIDNNTIEFGVKGHPDLPVRPDAFRVSSGTLAAQAQVPMAAETTTEPSHSFEPVRSTEEIEQPSTQERFASTTNDQMIDSASTSDVAHSTQPLTQPNPPHGSQILTDITEQSPVHTRRVQTQPPSSRMEIAATQSPLSVNASSGARLQSTQVNSSPMKSTPVNATQQRLEQIMARISDENTRAEVAGLVAGLMDEKEGETTHFNAAIKEAHEYVNFLKENNTTLKKLDQDSEVITTLNQIFTNNPDILSRVQSQRNSQATDTSLGSVNDDLKKLFKTLKHLPDMMAKQFEAHTRDTKTLLDYIDRRVNALHDRTNGTDEKVALLMTIEDGMADLHENIKKLKQWTESRLTSKLGKHQETLEKFNDNLQKIAEITMKISREHRDDKAVASKKIDEALRLASRLQRELTTLTEELNLDSVNKRLSKIEEQNDEREYQRVNDIEQFKQEALRSASSTEELKTKLQKTLGQDDMLSLSIAQLQKENKLMRLEMNEMKKILERVACLERKVTTPVPPQPITSQDRISSASNDSPLAQSTQQNSQGSPIHDNVSLASPELPMHSPSSVATLPSRIHTATTNTTDASKIPSLPAAMTVPAEWALPTAHMPTGPRSMGFSWGASTSRPVLPQKPTTERAVRELRHQSAMQASKRINGLLRRGRQLSPSTAPGDISIPTGPSADRAPAPAGLPAGIPTAPALHGHTIPTGSSTASKGSVPPHGETAVTITSLVSPNTEAPATPKPVTTKDSAGPYEAATEATASKPTSDVNENGAAERKRKDSPFGDFKIDIKKLKLMKRKF